MAWTPAMGMAEVLLRNSIEEGGHRPQENPGPRSAPASPVRLVVAVGRRSRRIRAYCGHFRRACFGNTGRRHGHVSRVGAFGRSFDLRGFGAGAVVSRGHR